MLRIAITFDRFYGETFVDVCVFFAKIFYSSLWRWYEKQMNLKMPILGEKNCDYVSALFPVQIKVYRSAIT